MNLTSYISILVLCIIFCAGTVISQTGARTIIVQTEPNATVWIDGVKRGVTDESGKLEVKPVKRGIRTLKIRAFGFKEVSKRLSAAQRGVITSPLVKTTSRSELAFQEAEKLVSEDKEKALELYRTAIRLRPRYSEAYVGLARALTGSDDTAALAAIAKARRIRPVYPEASTVEGRIYRSQNELDKAVDSFDRAVREGKGFQPEAHTGLGLIFKEDAENSNVSGDFDEEKENYEEAAKAFEKAIDQFSSTETIVYSFLGSIYEKMGQRQKAISVYERFLRDFPVHDERSVIQSYIVQLKKEIAGNP